MVKFSAQKNFSHQKNQKIGILLSNLGSPSAPTKKELKKYLKQFLSSPRVIEVSRLIWFFILNFIVIPFRSPKSANKYKTIWTDAGSPLIVYSKKVTDKLQQKISSVMVCSLAMSYGEPSIAKGLDYLRSQNCNQLLVLPMYPQYSATTVAEVFDLVTNQLQKWRWIPELRFINQYHDEKPYISAIAKTINKQIKKVLPYQKIIFSYHGTQLNSLIQGDPYHCQCYKTTRLIAQELKLKDSDYQVCFQSRFGSEPWLQPYTDKTLMELPQKGISEIFIICPGFSIDCLETLEEINEENKEIFLKSGGTAYHYLPCLNDSPEQLQLLQYLIKKHTQGWIVDNSIRNKQQAAYTKLKKNTNFIHKKKNDFKYSLSNLSLSNI